MVQASDLTNFYSLQPSSSQLPRDEEVVERAFWQSTPTALEELREGTDDECHQTVVSEDQDRPNDALSLSTQQSRLIRQTWAPAAGSIGRSSDGETQTSSRPKYRNRRGRAARPDSTANLSSESAVSSSANESMFFRHLKNIEKVSKTVDERMQKRKVQKEWSSKVISETARLRDGEEGRRLKENVNPNTSTMHGERTPTYYCSNDNDDGGDIAHVEAFDGGGGGGGGGDKDLLGLGTPQPDDGCDRASTMEEVPTSQSQERYLSLSHFSQLFPTESLGGAPAHRSTDQQQSN